MTLWDVVLWGVNRRQDVYFNSKTIITVIPAAEAESMHGLHRPTRFCLESDLH